jgi:dephospho-CoA kinase
MIGATLASPAVGAIVDIAIRQTPEENSAGWWSQDLILTVAGGVIVAAIVAFGQVIWSRRRVPTAISRAVHRKDYLEAVLAESERDTVRSLDVLAPRLLPARENPMIADIQRAWKRINDNGRVRVLTLDSDDCIEAGVELLSEGVEVRVARLGLGEGNLSYHVFEARQGSHPTAIVNHHDQQRNKDRPVRLIGAPLARFYSRNFSQTWDEASPLEAVLAKKIIDNAHGSTALPAIMRALHDIPLDLTKCLDKVLPRLAFRNSSSVIFVVGLPGAGKSEVRRRLAQRLKAAGIRSCELSDYVYAYRDFLHGLLQLEPARGAGFKAHRGGAFAVSDEDALRPALQALSQAVRDSLKDSESEVTIAEFARSDLVAALGEFDEIRSRSRVIYVRAPAELRSVRLNRRAEPPESEIDGNSVTFTLSDNHMLPTTAEQSLYARDDIDELARAQRWRGRITRIDNDIDDGGGKIDDSLTEFVTEMIDPYRSATVSVTRYLEPMPGGEPAAMVPLA